jgi:hypothetical protein
MLDQELVKQQLTTWMQDFVEKPNALLNNWPPCPFARQARVSNNIDIVFADPEDFDSAVQDSIDTLEHKEVVVICFDHRQISVGDLQSWVEATNQLLMPKNYVILEDHPESAEFVNGVAMNFGPCGLLVLQKLDKLAQAEQQLKAKGYYDTWDQAALDSVVTWRHK